MRGIEQRAARRLVHAARLHAHHAVLDEVDPADAVPATDRVERRDDRDGSETLAVDAHWRATLEADDDFLGLIGCLRRLRGEHEHVRLRRRIRILEVAALVREMPEIRVARIDLLLRRGDRDAARVRVVDRVLAAADRPLTPRRDDGQVGGECGEGHLEADLIVPLAGASVREGVGADAARDLDLALGDERSRHRGAEQILAVVDRAGAQGGKDEVANELLAKILDVAFGRARGERLLAHAAELRAALADVGGDADDARVVVLTKPRNDDRGVEPARVGEDDGARHGCS